MQIIRKRLSASEGQPPATRYDPDCECVQTTPDGGATWNDNPGADPRQGAAFRVPPLEGSSAQCDAAANMVAKIKANVDKAIAASSALEMANALLGITLAFLPGIGLLAAVIIAVAEAIWTIGSVALALAFDDDVYDQLTCTLLCNLDADGKMSNDQLVAFVDDVDANFDPVVAAVIIQTSRAWGAVGFSNAGALGTETGDCDDCACEWCYTWDFRASDGGWTADTYGTWVAGEGWQVNPSPSAILIRKTLDFTNSLRSMTVEYDNGGGAGVQAAYWYDGSYHSLATHSLDAGSNINALFHDTTTVDINTLAYNANADEGATVYIRRITVTGDYLTNPFGEDNC